MRSRATIKHTNKKLRAENEQLRRDLDSKYWSSAGEVLDELFHSGDPTLYCAAHRALRERSQCSQKTPASHVVAEQMIERAREPLLKRIAELEKQHA